MPSRPSPSEFPDARRIGEWDGIIPYRLALWLVVAATIIPLSLLVYSRYLDGVATAWHAGLLRANRLQSQTLETYLAGEGRSPTGQSFPRAWAELSTTREKLADDFPKLLDRTDPTWERLTAEATANRVSVATVERHLQAGNALIASLEMQARGKAEIADGLYWVGVGSLGVTLLAGALLAVRVRRLAARIGEQEAHFRAFMDTGPAAAFVKDEAGRMHYANRVCRERFALVPGCDTANALAPSSLPALRASDRATLAGDRAVVTEECVPEPNGRLSYWLSHKFPLAFADGRRLLGGLAIDITNLKKVEAELRVSEERLRLVVGALPTILYVVGRDGRVLLEEGRGLAAIGRIAGAAVGQSGFDLHAVGPVPSDLLRRALAGEPVGATTAFADHWFEVYYGPQRDDNGRVSGVVVVAADVTDRHVQLQLIQQQNRDLEAARKGLEELARHDALTGLPNRRAFDERLADEVARAARTGEPLAVVLADLDHFKRLNDELGHPAGDRTLQCVATALRQAVREVDTVARYGGEEFCVLLPGADADAANVAAERLRAAVAECDPPDRSVTASFGVAAWVPGPGGGADLLNAADRAMYRAKAAGRNRVATAPTLVPVTV